MATHVLLNDMLKIEYPLPMFYEEVEKLLEPTVGKTITIKTFLSWLVACLGTKKLVEFLLLCTLRP